MAEPTDGQPFFVYPGERVSVGDVGAALGTDARRGVVILEAGIPSPNIVDSGVSFTVRAQIRTAKAGAVPFALPAALVTHFHVHDLFTGAAAAGSPFIGGLPAPLLAPTGDHGNDGGFDNVRWYSIDSALPVLPDGTYRITVHGHAAPGVMLVHDGTIVHVGP